MHEELAERADGRYYYLPRADDKSIAEIAGLSIQKEIGSGRPLVWSDLEHRICSIETELLPTLAKASCVFSTRIYAKLFPKFDLNLATAILFKV
eukprot:4961096-Amphidinium_carterae.1